MAGPDSDCGFAPRPLPASEGREDVAERRQAVVARRTLLVIDHQQALWARSKFLCNAPDCLADLVLRDTVAVLALRLVGEDAGGTAARTRIGLGGRPGTTRTDQKAAMRAPNGVLRPICGHVLLYEQETVRAIGLGNLGCGSAPHPLRMFSPFTTQGKHVPTKRVRHLSTGDTVVSLLTPVIHAPR